MAYEPTTWASTDLITADKLNKIENGIANAEGRSWTFQVPVSSWILSNNQYIYSIPLENISSATWIEINLGNTGNYLTSDIFWSTSNDTLTLRTAVLPSNDLNAAVVAWGTIGSTTNQGELMGAINALEDRVDDIEDNIESLENKSDLKVNKANIYNSLDKATEGFVLDARQGKVLADGQNVNSQSIAAMQSSIAIIVDGDTVTTTIAEGQYVYIKNSTILSEGLYTANTAVPSGTVITSQNVSQYFAAVSNGGLNAIQQSLAIEEINVGTGMAAYKFQDFILLMSVGNGPAIPSTGLPMPAALKPDTYTFATAAVYTNGDWYTQDRWVELRADTGYLAAHNKSTWIDTTYTRFVMIYKAAN